MKHVLFISSNEHVASELGGSEQLWSRGMLRLHEQGIGVSANVNYSLITTPQIAAIMAKGCHVMARTLGPMFRSSKLRIFEKYGSRQKTYRWIMRTAPDLVVISQGSSFDGVWCANFCRENDIPYVVIVQAVNDRDWLSDYQATFAIRMFQEAQGGCSFCRPVTRH